MSKSRSGILLVLLVTGLIFPVVYMTAFPLSEKTLRHEYQYSQAKESTPNAKAVLASIEQMIEPTELNALRDRLGGVVQLPSIEENVLDNYVTGLFNFSDKMVEIERKLRETRESLTSGNIDQARADLDQLKELRNESGLLLKTLYVLLGRVNDRYEINATSQLDKIEGLEIRFQEYSAEIDQLEAQMTTETTLIDTILTLQVSANEVFVEESVFIGGSLTDKNGSALVGRNVSIVYAPNNAIVEVTDYMGEFETEILFPIGFASGPTEITAVFEPEGSDSEIYLPSSSVLQIQVRYYPSVLSADVSPSTVRILDFVDVRGNMSTTEGEPLAFRTIMILLDDSFIGNVTTNSTGGFSFRFQVPTISNGTHFLTGAFIPTMDRFEASNMTLPFFVELLETQLQMKIDRTSLFSGTNVKVDGTIRYTNGTTATKGNLSLYVDDSLYANTTVNVSGSYVFVIQIPVSLTFGSHQIEVVYYPPESWVKGSENRASIFVYNTPLSIAAALGVASVLSFAVFLTKRRRLKMMIPSPTITQAIIEQPLLKEEFTPQRLVSEIEAEEDPASKVRRSYQLAQNFLNQKMGEAPLESETPWEYLCRVEERIPETRDSLRRLVELFELVEYSPLTIDDSQSAEAKEALLQLREALETVKQ